MTTQIIQRHPRVKIPVNYIHGGSVSDDVTFPLVARSLYSPSSDIYIDTDEGTTNFKTSSRYPTDIMNMGQQNPHTWKFGTPLDPHMHWFQSAADIPNALLAYRITPEGGTPGAWTFLTLFDEGAFHEITYVSGTIEQRSHFPQILMTGIETYSCNVQYKLWRDATNVSTLFTHGNDTLAADWVTLWLDHHLINDKLGSPSHPMAT